MLIDNSHFINRGKVLDRVILRQKPSLLIFGFQTELAFRKRFKTELGFQNELTIFICHKTELIFLTGSILYCF